MGCCLRRAAVPAPLLFIWNSNAANTSRTDCLVATMYLNPHPLKHLLNVSKSLGSAGSEVHSECFFQKQYFIFNPLGFTILTGSFIAQ